MSGNLERRYRRVLRLLPGWYRDQWEEDMVAAFLDSWLTGDPEADAYITKAARPSWAEVASVAGLAIRLYLGGAATPRRYFAWGQAVRNAVLTMMLVHAVRDLYGFVLLTTHRLFGWLPAGLVARPTAASGGTWATVGYAVDCAWIVAFVVLILGYHRIAQVITALASVPSVVTLVQLQLAGKPVALLDTWTFWVLLDLVPVLAMAAFHRDAPPTARRPWLLALPATFLLVYVPLLALQETGHWAWVPDLPGLCCILVSLACLAHTPAAWSRRRASSGVWSLTLALLGAVAGALQIVSKPNYLLHPHLNTVSLSELVILLVAVALVAPDAVRAQAATPAPPPDPHTMAD